jgi:hypothetical protein
MPTVASYKCSCLAGYEGSNCAVNTDECASNPCQNGGICADYVDAWKCQCLDFVNGSEHVAFYGEFCEQKIKPCSKTENDCDPLHATCRLLGPGRHKCRCNLGWSGDGKTCRDIDECASKPCKNGAKCTQSACSPSSFPKGTACDPKSKGLPPVDSYSCACVAGFANGVCAAGWDKKSDAYTKLYRPSCTVAVGGRCDIDIDECISAPCQNGGGCTDSREQTCTSRGLLATGPGCLTKGRTASDAFTCTCATGWSDGICDLFAPAGRRAAKCDVLNGGVCGTDINECLSSPCANGGACAEFLGGYNCTCRVGSTGENCAFDVDECASKPCKNGAQCTDSSTNKTIALDAYVCVCKLGFVGSNCGVDVDECVSNPCVNGAKCTSLVGAYSCTCKLGYANGICGYNFIGEYAAQCTVKTGGNCNIDVDECKSSPCVNGASCTESTKDTTIAVGAYRCACVVGFAGGWCKSSLKASLQTAYGAACAISDSSSSTGNNGNCAIDVNECVSSPCKNGAKCQDSTALRKVSANAYRCACLNGFTNGMCGYSFVYVYKSECAVAESTANNAHSGNCDVDVNECASKPCSNNATCTESSTQSAVSVGAYRCTCKTGYANGMCGYAYIAAYAPQCSVRESVQNASLSGNCDLDVNECISSPCVNGAKCKDSSMDTSISVHAFQ